MSKYVFGIDVGGTTVKCGLFTVEGELLEKWEIVTRTEENGKYIISDVADTINAKIAEKGLDKADVAGIGMGVPGPVDDQGIVRMAVNLHWTEALDLGARMKELTGLTCVPGNDANVAALGEQWKGAGVGTQNMIMVTLGTGVGGGIIIGEKIVAGTNGAGGEIGHIHVDDAITDPCNCGCCGCLEQVASATGIVRLAKEELAASDEPSQIRDGEVSAKSVFDAVKEGDALAIRVAERFGSYLGKALSVLAAVVDPEAIVIGGGVSKAGDVLLDYISRDFRTYAFPACRDTRLILATLGNDAGIYGAAKMLI